jgi:lipoyl(octanoyl) transferase
MLSTQCVDSRSITELIAAEKVRFANGKRCENLVREPNQTRRTCWTVDWGMIPYPAACDLQHELVLARKADAIPDVLLLCEHPHIITLGRNGKREHLRAGTRVLEQMHVAFHPTDRGGDITYHGPGQIVGYPILDLAGHRRDVRWYVEQLEEMMIRATAAFGIVGTRREGAHGVWVETPSGEEKLAALGVHLSRWVTSHGFAYNVSTDLRYFDLIIPCGIPDKRVTSLERLLRADVSTEEVLARLVEKFGGVFGLTMVSMPRLALETALAKITAVSGRACELAAGFSISREVMR